jgi:hypothetical protein
MNLAQLCPKGTRHVSLMSSSSGVVQAPSYNVIPSGVHLVAILNVVIGLFAMYTGGTVAFVVAGGEVTLVGSFQIGTIFVGIAHVIAGAGLWKQQYWAWWLSFLISFFGLLLNLSIVLLDFTQLQIYFLAMLLRTVILIYLLEPPIRDSFK